MEQLQISPKLWLLAGFLPALFSLGFLLYTATRPRAQTQTLEILTQAALDAHFVQIRIRYSALHSRLQSQWRIQRRSFSLGSSEYFQFVRKCHNKLRDLEKQAATEYFSEINCPLQVFEDSLKYYKSEDVRLGAEVRVAINEGPIPKDLTVGRITEALDYYRERLQTQDLLQHSLPLALYQIEDEIYAQFGFEIEEVERGATQHCELFRDYEEFLQSIRDTRLLEAS